MMKRKAESSPEASAPKAAKVADYCSIRPKQDANGNPIWPAPEAQMNSARRFLRECAAAQKPTLLVPDKDADGLSSGAIVHRTLVKLGLDLKLLDVHLVQKGSNIHKEDERRIMAEKKPKFVIVLDQGSRGGPPVIETSDARCLIVDHHLSDEFPKDAIVSAEIFLDQASSSGYFECVQHSGAFILSHCDALSFSDPSHAKQIVSACHYPPVATTSLTAYEICKDLHQDIAVECGYLCAIGTHGDLGNNLKWLPPFPNMSDTFQRHTKNIINRCVSYINAPRRTGTYDVITAWKALLEAEDPKQILSNRRLAEARQEINMEVEIQTHIPPKFSKDGKIAVLKIDSKAQVHPVIATRWASHLKSKALEIVMVANYGYLPGKVNFSCRIAKCAQGRDPPVNIIESLKAVASLDTANLVQRLGDNFAKGHKEASGGIVGTAEFEELCLLMKIGEKPDKPSGDDSLEKKPAKAPQKNTLNNYFKKS